VLSGFFICIALVLLARLYVVQIIDGDEYTQHALGQYIETSPTAEDRGSIFFTDKDGNLVASAVMQKGWRVAIRPSDIVDAEATYAALNAIVPIDRERFSTSVAKQNDPYEEIAFRVSNEDVVTIRALELPGVIFSEDRWRVYPAEKLAAHAIGFWGFAGDVRRGVYGLEKYFDDTLSRVQGGLYINPFAELFTNIGALLTSDPTEYAGDIITSIEPTTEARMEEVLDSIMKTYLPRQAGGIIMDPKTGEIIAFAVRPAFDPNTYNTLEDVAIFSNPLVENIYEMGSIMKPLTMASGIDAGAISPDTTYRDEGFIMKSGKKISNFDGKGRGVVSMQEVLNQSLNTGASFVVDTMGHDVFATYIDATGLGKETGIDVPNEARGLLGALSEGTDVDYASASFGQGIATSPIAMTRALASLANEGMLPEPHIVRAVRLKSGIVRTVSRESRERFVTAETAETVTRMLSEVFDDALLGGVLKQQHYSIAAKTGTAQIANPSGGGYYADRFLHSFFGYLPAYEPRFIVFLYALEPQKEKYASGTLARPFLDIAKFLINYYDIPPDR